MAGTLHIGLEGQPPHAVITSDGSVEADLWNALGRNLAPGQAVRLDDRLILPIERVLAGRAWLAEALRTHSCAAEFDDAFLALIQREDDERRQVTALVASGEVPTVDHVAGLLATSRFRRELREFQLRDLAHLLALANGANFSVPGAGKTTVTYALHELERQRGRVDRLLVVGPLSAFEAWVEEAEECLDPAPVVRRFEGRIPHNTEVLLINYQRLAAHYDRIADWVRSARTHVVLDEAHRMKRGRDGEWGNACLNLAFIAARRDVLTGTPAPQHPNDFTALIDFLWPNQARRVMPAAALRRDPPPQAMADLSARLRPLFARTTKDELQLRAPDLRVELVKMKPLQEEIYDSLRRRMRQTAVVAARDATRLGEIGEVVMYLLQAAINPGLLAPALSAPRGQLTWPSVPVAPGTSLAQTIVNYASHEVPAKFEKLATMVAANAQAGRKTLVWSNFVANIEELSRSVLAPYQPAVVHGGVRSAEARGHEPTRETELDRFRHDDACTALIANPAAMSEGVSLHHTCHDAIYVDRTFNAGQYLQSLDRIHRLGLPPETETRITFLVSRDTVDETVDRRIRLKAERLSELLADDALVTMALPDEEAYGEWIEPEDLEELLAHLIHADD